MDTKRRRRRQFCFGRSEKNAQLIKQLEWCQQEEDRPLVAVLRSAVWDYMVRTYGTASPWASRRKSR